MTNDIQQPAGFPNCPRCFWLTGGTHAVCFACAARTLILPARPCPVCSQSLPSGTPCRNRLCSSPNRVITRISSIAVYSGDLADRIRLLKYDGRTGWALIFGRLVHGWLNANRHPAETDLVLPNPTHADRAVRHTELIVDSTRADDTRSMWSIPGTDTYLVKRTVTARSANQTLEAKIQAARAHAAAVDIRTPVDGKRVLLVDDVCTSGAQLEFLARKLIDHGAASVEALVLARTPTRPR